MPISNSATVFFQPNLPVLVQAFANAAYAQQVTITPPSGAAAVYQGTGGNNQPMTLKTPGFLSAGSNGGWASFTAAAGVYTITVMATNNGVQTATPVSATQFSTPTPGGGTAYLAQASSEDATDNDWNDSLVLFTSWTA